MPATIKDQAQPARQLSEADRMMIALDLACKIVNRFFDDIPSDGFAHWKLQQLCAVIAELPPEKLTSFVRKIQNDILEAREQAEADSQGR
jgi:hypothetical protein